MQLSAVGRLDVRVDMHLWRLVPDDVLLVGDKAVRVRLPHRIEWLHVVVCDGRRRDGRMVVHDSLLLFGLGDIVQFLHKAQMHIVTNVRQLKLEGDRVLIVLDLHRRDALALHVENVESTDISAAAPKHSLNLLDGLVVVDVVDSKLRRVVHWNTLRPQVSVLSLYILLDLALVRLTVEILPVIVVHGLHIGLRVVDMLIRATFRHVSSHRAAVELLSRRPNLLAQLVVVFLLDVTLLQVIDTAVVWRNLRLTLSLILRLEHDVSISRDSVIFSAYMHCWLEWVLIVLCHVNDLR